jgi:tRNA dimethylallyltransferase
VASGAHQRTLHVVTGCSGVGKTEWALVRAEELGAEIVSCDSLLFYRGMDIGTAKPTKADRERVPHHLIDIRDVVEPVDVTQYVALARDAVDAIAARGRPVLVVGGSGFYLRAFFAPVADEVRVAPELRAGIAARLSAEGMPALVEDLRRLNPGGLGSLDTANPRRVTRALERCMASGESLASLGAAFSAQPGPFSGWNVELTELVRPPAELDQRIAGRARDMLARGLVEEVTRLRAAGLGRNPSAARAIGYRETIAFLEGRLPGDMLESEIVKNTRALVKKQRTWFRTQLPATRSVVDLSIAADL